MQHAKGGGVGRILAFAALVVIAVLAPSGALALQADAYEPDDIPTAAGILGVNLPDAQSRTLHGFDMDWVRVGVEAGVPCEFIVMSRPGLAPANVQMTLWPAEIAGGGETWSLASVTTSFGADRTTVTYTPAETGELYLAVEAMDFAGEASYSLAAYSGQYLWDEFENADLPPLFGMGFMCGDPAVERALMSPDDADWFNVWVPRAGEYQLRTWFSALAPPPDTLLEVWDASGTTLLASNDNDADGGPLSSVHVVASSEATVWRVRVTSAAEPVTGAYTFSAMEVPRTMGSVSGSVTGPDGETVEGALVELLGMDYSVVRTTRTLPNGSYAFEGVAYGAPFRLRADIEGAGLVPDLQPETRHLTNPEVVEGLMIGEGIPDLRQDLRIRRPWVSGWVNEAQAPYAMLPGMSATVYGLGGEILGTGTTSPAGTYYIELPPFTTGQCKVAVIDPSGVHRTTWWWDSAEEATAPSAAIPTFGGLSVYMPLAPEAPRDVLFDLGDVRVVFDEVTAPGTVTATATSPLNLPAIGFRMVLGRHYDIHPTLGFAGGATVTVSIPAEEADSASSMRLFHWEDGRWVDITTSVDPAGMTVTGRTTTFSEFSLQSTEGAELEATSTSPLVTLGVVLIVALVLVDQARRRSGRADRQ